MAWQDVIGRIGDFLGEVRQLFDRFYLETSVGGTTRYFLIPPVFVQTVDTDGSGRDDLSVQVAPAAKLPVDTVELTFKRFGAAPQGLAARLYFGVDDGVAPAGTPSKQMRFAYAGFSMPADLLAPELLRLSVQLHTDGPITEVTLRVQAESADVPLRVHGGLLTSPVAVKKAGSTRIRTALPEQAEELLEGQLELGRAGDEPLALLDTAPLRVGVRTGGDSTQVLFGAPVALPLVVGAVQRTGGSERRLRCTVPRMPQQLTAALAAGALTVSPGSALTADVCASGLPLPPPLGASSLSARLGMWQGIQASWTTPPLQIRVGPSLEDQQPGVVSFNARLLPGVHDLASLPAPPEPQQALIAEYDEGKDAWLAVDALDRLRFDRETDDVSAVTSGTLTLADPRGAPPAVPARSLRVSARTGGRLTADIRASLLDPDEERGRAGTLAGTLSTSAGAIRAELTGRLRHLRIRHESNGTRSEVWTPVTPTHTEVTWDGGQSPARFSLTPARALELAVDHLTAVGISGFSRLFGRIQLCSSVRGQAGEVPRRPVVTGTAAAGSSPSVHGDSRRRRFPPELVGMSLRYDTGTNRGHPSRSITAVDRGALTTDPFPFPPAEGDRFTVVTTTVDVRAEGRDTPAARRGISLAVSAGREAGQRIATRTSPQLLRLTTSSRVGTSLLPAPLRTDAIAARLDGVVAVALPPPNGPGQGWLAADVSLDPDRPLHSLRYAEDRAWLMPDSARMLIGDLPRDDGHAPCSRVLLVDAPHTVSLRQKYDGSSLSHAVTMTGGSGRGWIWMLAEQPRWNGELAGTGVTALDLMQLPRMIEVTTSPGLNTLRRSAPPQARVWRRSGDWAPVTALSVSLDGVLEVRRLVHTSYSPGPGGRADGSLATYPATGEDAWAMMTATMARLSGTSGPLQRITVWQLASSDQGDPDAESGIGLDVTGMTTELDLDRYMARLPQRLRSSTWIPWLKQVEIQLKDYTGAWLLDGGLAPAFEANENGFWFLRAVQRLGIDPVDPFGDAYFGNTPGDITGRERLYPVPKEKPEPPTP